VLRFGTPTMLVVPDAVANAVPPCGP